MVGGGMGFHKRPPTRSGGRNLQDSSFSLSGMKIQKKSQVLLNWLFAHMNIYFFIESGLLLHNIFLEAGERDFAYSFL